jgi:hypothetical protein
MYFNQFFMYTYAKELAACQSVTCQKTTRGPACLCSFANNTQDIPQKCTKFEETLALPQHLDEGPNVNSGR